MVNRTVPLRELHFATEISRTLENLRGVVQFFFLGIDRRSCIVVYELLQVNWNFVATERGVLERTNLCGLGRHSW